VKIVVLVKEVPDTYGERKLNLETGLAERGLSDRVADEISERALEVALSYADAVPETEIHILTVAPEGATKSLRKILAMGGSAATHVADEALLGADLGLTSEVIAAALEKIGFDLVIAGNQSTDGMGGVLPAMLAERLKLPAALQLSEVTIEPEQVSGVRASDDATQQLSAPYPAIISITEALPDPRFPNFKGIMAAKKKPIEVWSLSDLGLDADDLSVGRAIMLKVSELPPKSAGVKVVDDGTAAAQLAAFLIEQRLA